MKKSKNRIEVQLLALAEYAIKDEGNRLSVLGIFDKLFITQLPASQTRMFLVITLIGEERDDGEIKIRIISPTGKEEFKIDTKISFKGSGKTNLVVGFENFSIKEVGEYRVQLEHDEEVISTYKLDVIVAKKEQNGSKLPN